MNLRLAALLAKIKDPPKDSIILDCYNQGTFDDVAMTITTRIDANIYYLLERIDLDMEQEPKIMQIGNTTENAKRENPQRGRVYSPDGIAPTLNTCGGGNLEPQILESARVLQVGNLTDDTNRTFKNPEQSRVYSVDGVSPTLKAAYSDRLVLEPTAVAMRGRGKPAVQHLEMGDDIANCLTTVQKDSMVVEPIPVPAPDADAPADADAPGIRLVGNIYPSGGQGGKVVDPNGIAPTVCECHGEVTRIVEEPIKVRQATKQGYIECPTSGCFDPNYPSSNLRRGRVQENGTVSPTLTAQGEPPWLNEGGAQQAQTYYYRIRKLHPIETFRLQDIDDADIDKLMNAKDEKGKPMLSKSACYNLAGDSITVAPLFYLFENLFYGDNTNPNPQLTLF